ncbi:hypothetical protein [Pseudaestuariivita atlantica]|uniref:DUF948 domain-containing protein n=1 Tax=Pseudaestuariivita atlantica TaxID=1317121 RepID=A0A0L1JKC3_9RHOB|nr:hypothetical protein [Pseudaestuariivita atlantica]KNG92196.1 hypothetical protein ATO11_18605 [Pseudaestuariivita atlantica]
MSTLALTIWIVTLVIVVVVIVPLALALLSRALRNARAIEGYLEDMLEAGVKIVGHTKAIPALDDTLATAAAMAPVATAIEEKTGIVAGMLAKRAEEDPS